MATPLEHASRLASELFLVPENVTRVVSYWVSQYTNYERSADEADHFSDLVEGLLTAPPRLYLVQSPPSAATLNPANCLKGQWVVQFAGRQMHRLPLEVLARFGMARFFDSLCVLLPEAQDCFRAVSDDNLGGELELGDFVYDAVLQHMAEPSFMVGVAYAVHLAALVNTTGCQSTSDWVPRHLQSLQAISAERRALLCDADAQRLERTRSDLERLYDILNDTELESMMDSVTQFLSGKGQACYDDIVPRFNRFRVAQ